MKDGIKSIRLFGWVFAALLINNLTFPEYTVGKDNFPQIPRSGRILETKKQNASKSNAQLSQQSSQFSNLKRPSTALRPDLIHIKYRNLIPGQDSIVYLIGENHASVKTQIQLATLLEELLKATAINAILIEGSKGPIDANTLLQRIPESLIDQQRKEYWKRQLEWNRIAGYEYVALMHPDIAIVGVEDLDAKEHYEISNLKIDKEDFELEKNFKKDAVELFEKAQAKLRERLTTKYIQLIQTNLNLFKEANVKYEERWVAYSAENTRRVEQLHNRLILIKEIQRLRYIVADALKQDEDLKEEVKSYNDQVRNLNKEIQKYNQSVQEPQDKSGSSTLGMDRWVERREQEIERRQFYIQQMLLPSIFRVVLNQLNELASFQKALDEVHIELDLLDQKLSIHLEELNQAFLLAQDRYFILANLIREIGEGEGMAFPEIESFFAHKAKALKEHHQNKNRNQELFVRDTAIVGNVIKFLTETNKKAVALIVGSSHLEGIADQFKVKQVSFIGGTLTTVDAQIESWEVKAWENRQNIASFVFARFRELKEPSLFLDVNWGSEELAKLEFFQDIQSFKPTRTPTVKGLIGDGKIFEEGKEHEYAIQVGQFTLDRNAEVGNHIIDRGPIPGLTGGVYEVTDRRLAKKMVSELSDADSTFIYYRKTAQKGQTQFQFTTPHGEKDLNDFMKESLSPSEGIHSKSTVMFGEAEEIVVNDLVESPLFKRLKGAPVYRSINPHRAKRNLKKLSPKYPMTMEEITVIREENLGKMAETLKFTPTAKRTGRDDSQIVVFLGRNVPGFREVIHTAAKNKKLENKVVLLITCGDAYYDTAKMREDLLSGGVAGVWHPTRQITPQTGERLLEEMQEVLAQANQNRTPLDIQDLVKSALQNWKVKDPVAPERQALEQSDFWVENRLQDQGIEAITKKTT